MKISRRAVLGILLFGLLLLTGILLRSAILENFVRPVALLLWMTNRVFASVDQVVYWFMLILIILFITFTRITISTKNLETFTHSAASSTLENMNLWRTMILTTQDETVRKNLLRQSLANLLRDVYASKQPHRAPWEIYDALEQGEIPLPDSLRDFLLLNQKQPPSLIQRLQHAIQAPSRWVHHWTGQDVRDYYASIEEVIAFMEKKLESEDDE